MDLQGENFLSSTESERERAFFQLLESMMLKNEIRYQQQAKELLMNKELSFSIGNNLLFYRFENRGCALRISNDGGFNFNFDNWVSLPRGKGAKLTELLFQFASREAQLILNSA